jgi:phosphoribosyl 1,2-cyclic phosphodiesterase
MRRLHDRRHVLHLEAEGARRFQKHRTCVRLEQFLDPAAGERIVIAHLDAELLERRVAEMARRVVGAVGDQQMIARFQHR